MKVSVIFPRHVVLGILIGIPNIWIWMQTDKLTCTKNGGTHHKHLRNMIYYASLLWRLLSKWGVSKISFNHKLFSSWYALNYTPNTTERECNFTDNQYYTINSSWLLFVTSYLVFESDINTVVMETKRQCHTLSQSYHVDSFLLFESAMACYFPS